MSLFMWTLKRLTLRRYLVKIQDRFSWQLILRYAFWVGCDGIFSKVLKPPYQPTWRTPTRTIHCLDKVKVCREQHLPKQNMQSCHMAFFIKAQCNLQPFSTIWNFKIRSTFISSASRLFGGTVSTAHYFVSNTLWTGRVWEEGQNIIY
jgi:hypothetical protein